MRQFRLGEHITSTWESKKKLSILLSTYLSVSMCLYTVIYIYMYIYTYSWRALTVSEPRPYTLQVVL